jgi:maleylacetoacetate isomerase
MTAIVLHDYFRSSASYRVRIALNLKGLAYEQRPVSLVDGAQKSEAYRALNPQGFVPMLEVDGHRLTQSLAIIEYLDARFPEPRLIPADPAAAATVRALSLIVACDIHPLNNLRVLRYLKTELGQQQEAVDTWYRHWVAEGLAALEAHAAPHLAHRSDEEIEAAPVNLADVFLVPQLFNARRFDVDLSPFPTLVRADAILQRHPAFAAAHPDRQESAT